jgi:hypothetical protein
MKYGLNNFITSQTLSSLSQDKTLTPSFIPVRVVDIVLDDSHPKFKEVGEWNGLGSIFYQDISSPTTEQVIEVAAKPAIPNLKYFPLKNEIVYLLFLPTPDSQTSSGNEQLYYLSVISVWNSQHHNAIPNGLLKDSQSQDYEQTEAGDIRRITDGGTEIDLGKTFVEKPNINPLLPYEGDFIQEGRWGNSIRFGSTVKGKTNWSKVGENGDPITIIRNGEDPNNGSEGWIPVVEDINNDLSSIWFTSTQQIPLEPSSFDYSSFTSPPEGIPQYSGPQIMVNSDRVVLNSKTDHTLISSAKSVSLNAVDSVNIDTEKHIVDADSILLGNKNATEPLMLGNKTVDLLSKILDEMTSVMGQLSSLTSLPPGTPFIPLNAQAISSQARLNLYKNQLRTLLSKQNKTI